MSAIYWAGNVGKLYDLLRRQASAPAAWEILIQRLQNQERLVTGLSHWRIDDAIMKSQHCLTWASGRFGSKRCDQPDMMVVL